MFVVARCPVTDGPCKRITLPTDLGEDVSDVIPYSR